MPAIGRRIEELPAGTPMISIVSVTGPADEKTVVIEADHRAIWIHRPALQADDPSLILATLAQFLPPTRLHPRIRSSRALKPVVAESCSRIP